MSVSYHVYDSKIYSGGIWNKICEFVSERAAFLVLSGFIVLEVIKSIHCCKKIWSFISRELLFI